MDEADHVLHNRDLLSAFRAEARDLLLGLVPDAENRHLFEVRRRHPATKGYSRAAGVEEPIGRA